MHFRSSQDENSTTVHNLLALRSEGHFAGVHGLENWTSESERALAHTKTTRIHLQARYLKLVNGQLLKESIYSRLKRH